MKRWGRAVLTCILLIVAVCMFLACTETGQSLSAKAFLKMFPSIKHFMRELPRDDARLIAKHQGDSIQVFGITFTADGKWIFSCGRDGLKQWDGSSFALESSQEFDLAERGRRNSVYSVAADHSRPILYLGTTVKDVQIWDYEVRKIVGTIPTRDRWWHSVPEVVISPNGKVLAIAENGGKVKGEIEQDDFTILLWDLENGKEIRRLSGHGKPVSSVEFFPDGKKLYTHANNVIWDIESGEIVYPKESLVTAKHFLGDVSSYHGFTFVPKDLDFQFKGEGELDKKEKLILKTSIPIAKRFAKNGIQAGKYILQAGQEGYFFLYDSQTGKPLTSYQQFGNGTRVSVVAVSPDGALIAAGGEGRALKGGFGNDDIQSDRNFCIWRLEPRTTRQSHSP